MINLFFDQTIRALKRAVSNTLLSCSGELQIPFWEKYTLSIEEAAEYFRIGENKLRNMINSNKLADYILWNGNRAQIKRKLFEKHIDQLSFI